jgi:hypothetical protein
VNTGTIIFLNGYYLAAVYYPFTIDRFYKDATLRTKKRRHPTYPGRYASDKEENKINEFISSFLHTPFRTC